MDTKATPYSNLKIFHHINTLNKVVKEKKWIAPIYIRIKPTNFCNHKCHYCFYADSGLNLKKQDMISWEKMQEIIADIKEMGVRAVTFSGGGEPLTYPHIVDAMQHILDAEIDLSIITNGQLLKGERAQVLSKAKWVRVSCDAADSETYAKERNLPLGVFDEVCENIKNFSDLKSKDCELGINFVINHVNAGQIYDMAVLVKGLGVNHIKYTASITKDGFEYHKPFKDKVIMQIHKAQEELEGNGFKIINKYESDFDSPMLSHRCYERCYINYVSTVIAADEKVYFCHDKAYSVDGEIGDLSRSSFKELWFSKDIQDRLNNFDPQKECNHHCVYDDRNELLNAFYALDTNHINFI